MAVQEQVDWGIFDTLTVDCQLTEKEILAGNSLNWRSKFKFKNVSIVYICYIALIYLVMFLIDSRIGIFDLVTTALVILGFLVLMFSFMRFVGQRRAKTYFRKMPSSRRPAKLGWDANGLYVASVTNRTFYPWTDFQSWAEDKTVLALLFAGPLMVPLPKSALTEQQLAELKAHIVASALPKARLFPI